MTEYPALTFHAHMVSSDVPIECGEVLSTERGWTTYLKARKTRLTMPPRIMRTLGERYRDHPDAPDEARSLGERMIACANVANGKNERDGYPV